MVIQYASECGATQSKRLRNEGIAILSLGSGSWQLKPWHQGKTSGPWFFRSL